MNHRTSVSDAPRGLLITGTDTGVGKTHLTCLIARQLLAMGLCTAAYKPVCSGAVSRLVPRSGSIEQNSGTAAADLGTELMWDDIDRLSEATNRIWSELLICPQKFIAPLAPPVAASLEGRSVDFEMAVAGAYRFPGAEIVLVEGAGGWLSPVSESATVADLAQKLNLPVLIVSRTGLGTINHTLLTIESVRGRGLPVAGVVMNEAIPTPNDLSCKTNADEIARRGTVPVLGVVPHGMQCELQRDCQTVTIAWQDLAGPILKSRSA